MPFSGNTFTLPSGATTAAPGQIVQSAVWNAIHSDLNTGLTQLMSQLTTLMTGRNLVGDNGGFEVWQRGTSVGVAASTIAYTADRWYLNTGASGAFTVSQVTGLTTPSQFACKVQRNAGQTGVVAPFFGFPIDTQELNYARGAVVTLTFVVKAGANWSPASGTLGIALAAGTGTPVKYALGGYTSATTPISSAVALTPGGSNTSVSLNSSVIVPANTAQMEVVFSWTPVGTAGADDSFTIDDVQLEVDYSTTTWTPTSFDREPFDEQLNNCGRHFAKTFPYSTAPAQGAVLIGAVGFTSQGNIKGGFEWQYPGVVNMRIIPTWTTYNPLGASANWQDITAAASLVATVDTASASGSSKSVYISCATVAATDHQVLIHITASAGI